MGGGGKLAGRLLFGDQRIDHTGVFAVHPGNTAKLLQLLQRLEHCLVADHHGGIGHVHFEGADTLLEHFRKLGNDAFIPIVNGHVEAVVARGAAVCLLVPQVKTVLQRFALVRAGEVNDHGRAAAQRGASAGIKIVGRRGVAHVEVKVGMRVDETGEEQLAADIDKLGLGTGQRSADFYDLLAVDKEIGCLTAVRVYDGAALEKLFHKESQLLFPIYPAAPHMHRRPRRDFRVLRTLLRCGRPR